MFLVPIMIMQSLFILPYSNVKISHCMLLLSVLKELLYGGFRYHDVYIGYDVLWVGEVLKEVCYEGGYGSVLVLFF